MSNAVYPLDDWRTRWRMPDYGNHAYILRDRDDLAIYVGQSANVCRRLYQHGCRWWYPLAATIELRECADRAAARALELDLIRELDPVANIVGSPSKQDAA